MHTRADDAALAQDLVPRLLLVERVVRVVHGLGEAAPRLEAPSTLSISMQTWSYISSSADTSPFLTRSLSALSCLGKFYRAVAQSRQPVSGFVTCSRGVDSKLSPGASGHWLGAATRETHGVYGFSLSL